MKQFLRQTTIALTLLAASISAIAQTPVVDVNVRRAHLQQLLQQEWETRLQTSPEMATFLGDNRFNHLLSQFSDEAHAKDVARMQKFLAQFEAIDVSGMNEHEKLNRQLMIASLREELDGERFKSWEMPVAQNGGVHLIYPQLANIITFSSTKDYEDYLARLQQIPRVFDETMAQMRNGMRDGLMPPQHLLQAVAKQCEKMANAPLERTPFAAPLKKMPDSIAADEQKRLRTAIEAAISEKVNPAYKKLAAFVNQEYAPKGRSEVGVWSLPDGKARYAYMVKTNTSSNLSPDQIHQLGLKEVARIEAELLQLAKKMGYPDVKSMDKGIKNDPKMAPKSRQEILDLYTKYINDIYPKMEQLFGRLPKAKVQVKQIEEFREDGGPGAHYNPASPDGSRAGSIMINTSQFASRNKAQMESTALHEGVPGHHFQIAIAQELPSLPDFRKNALNTAFIEGWALYAERLGREVGAYQEPSSYYGHLQAEMLRAIRLVVDTGLHDKKWTRQQVVDFFHQHSGIDEVEVQSETDRYIANPGQALAYKIGQIQFLQLRSHAQQELGEQFDIRQFHDVVLGSGALPLDILELQVKNWVASKKTLAQSK